MSYVITNTNNQLIATVEDYTVNATALPITLIGHYFSGFGEILNDNLVGMLENFSSVAAPTSPIIGQLWYNKPAATLNQYDQTTSPPWTPLATQPWVSQQVAANQIAVPLGGIIIWSGTPATIPYRFHLCDGTKGTANLPTSLCYIQRMF